jgi:hypothetical protein
VAFCSERQQPTPTQHLDTLSRPLHALIALALQVIGTMAVDGPKGLNLRRTFYNGACLTSAQPSAAGEPEDVVVEKIIHGSYIPPKMLATYSVQLGIQTTLLVAENVLSYRFNAELASVSMQYAKWLGKSLTVVRARPASCAVHVRLPGDSCTSTSEGTHGPSAARTWNAPVMSC